MTTLEILKTTRAAWPSVRDIPEESRNRLLTAMADRLLSDMIWIPRIALW